MPPPGAHQVVGADLRAEAAGDLGHRGEQRERAVAELDGLVGDAGDLVVKQRVGAGLVRGQVQVGEEDQARAHPVVLLGDRLLDLEHHVGDAPDLVGVWDDGRAGRDVGVVGELRASARVLLQVDLVAVTGSSRTPAGVIATRYSWFLTSRGMPTFMACLPFAAGGGCRIYDEQDAIPLDPVCTNIGY